MHECDIDEAVRESAYRRRRDPDELRQVALIGLWAAWPMWRDSDDKAATCQAIVRDTLQNPSREKQNTRIEPQAKRLAVAKALWADPDSLSASNGGRYERFTSWLRLLDTTRPALTKKQRMTFYMRHVLKLTEAEIADIQGVTQQMVSKRLAACARRLHQQAERVHPGKLLELDLHDTEQLGDMLKKRL